MEDDQDLDFGVARAAPALVSLTLFSPFVSPSPRRLSSHFNQPSRPVPAARQLTWVSLQGRLVGAEESSSVGAIRGSLSREESVAWELFSPIHRILIIAVVAVATAELKKSRQIWRLKRSVNLRDQVLSSMQQKLDDMCKQMNTMKDQSENVVDMSFTKNKEYPFAKDTKSNKATLLDCGCRLCNEHHASSNSLMCQILNQRDSVEKACGGDEVFKLKMPLTNGAVQEERRISDLSDWASSVTSAADIQLSTLAIEQDIYNLRRECEEKDATIKELSAVVHASDVSGSKRMAELEDIIRRKNMIIARLKKEMVVLEQQVVHLTRLRRPFFSASSSNIRQFPAMADNLLYDMDSSTSPSSSDSDRPVENQSHGSIHEDHKNLAPREAITVRKIRTVTKAKTPDFLPKPTNNSLKLRSVSPLKENSMNQRPDLTVTLRQRQSVSADGYMKRNRRHTQTSSKDMTPQKRWV